MAEEQLTTPPGEQKAPLKGKKIQPQDFSCEIDYEIDQLITLSELVRIMEDEGGGEKRAGFYYGMANIIEGSADRIKSMVEPYNDYMYQKGRELAFKNAIQASEAEATLLQITTREMEEMTAHLIKLHQDPEFNFDMQAKIILKGFEDWRTCLKNYLEKLGV